MTDNKVYREYLLRRVPIFRPTNDENEKIARKQQLKTEDSQQSSYSLVQPRPVFGNQTTSTNTSRRTKHTDHMSMFSQSTSNESNKRRKLIEPSFAGSVNHELITRKYLITLFGRVHKEFQSERLNFHNAMKSYIKKWPKRTDKSELEASLAELNEIRTICQNLIDNDLVEPYCDTARKIQKQIVYYEQQEKRLESYLAYHRQLMGLQYFDKLTKMKENELQNESIDLKRKQNSLVKANTNNRIIFEGQTKLKDYIIQVYDEMVIFINTYADYLNILTIADRFRRFSEFEQFMNAIELEQKLKKCQQTILSFKNFKTLYKVYYDAVDAMSNSIQQIELCYENLISSAKDNLLEKYLRSMDQNNIKLCKIIKRLQQNNQSQDAGAIVNNDLEAFLNECETLDQKLCAIEHSSLYVNFIDDIRPKREQYLNNLTNVRALLGNDD